MTPNAKKKPEATESSPDPTMTVSLITKQAFGQPVGGKDNIPFHHGVEGPLIIDGAFRCGCKVTYCTNPLIKALGWWICRKKNAVICEYDHAIAVDYLTRHPSP